VWHRLPFLPFCSIPQLTGPVPQTITEKGMSGSLPTCLDGRFPSESGLAGLASFFFLYLVCKRTFGVSGPVFYWLDVLPVSRPTL